MKITLNPHLKDEATRVALIAEGGFGKHYTDHMIVCDWSEKDGWDEPELKPYGPISLDPATAVFHYGQEVFEGLIGKAERSGVPAKAVESDGMRRDPAPSAPLAAARALNPSAASPRH